MEWIRSLLDNGTAPALTAVLLGLLTAISPCPLATNIAAIGYIGKDVADRRKVFRNGLLYTLGRIVAYTVLGVVLLFALDAGAKVFGIQRFFGTYGEILAGPALLLVGLFMFFGKKLNLSRLGIRFEGERFARRGGWGALWIGVLFALAFCPTSGVFYFGVLIPLAASVSAGFLLPVLFAAATALPVIASAWLLAFSVRRVSGFYGKMRIAQRWLNGLVGGLFVVVGLYYCYMVFC